ncbi:MAG: hypothetical protein Q8S18_14455 [Bacteroidales bacterium]|nr:hypothetical protein [Bacteroidales bacterium]
MKTSRFFLLFITITWLFACEPAKNNSSASEAISALENNLYDQEGNLELNTANELISKYEAWADSLPNAPQTPEYLFIGADLSINMPNVSRTMRLLDKIIKDYPTYDKRGLSMFLKAFVYEEQLNDTSLARKQYELFLSEYPEHDFSDDAKLAIRNLGKTPEDLIREFEMMESE